MKHERARFVLTTIGAIAPIIAMGMSLVIFIWATPYAALGAALAIIASILIIAGQAAFVSLTLIWNCRECDRQYFAFFMPYWPFDRVCQNCRLPD